jgi:uncharacterized protein (UPF0332 family)
MKLTFNDCLKKRRIFKAKYVYELIASEIEDAEEDLKASQEAFKNSNYKWSTIQAYYSMFHSARALLYSKGYEEKGHYCLYLAIKELFVKEKILPETLVDKFLNGMILRENADYKRDHSQEGANAVIQSAKDFFKSAKEIVNISEEKVDKENTEDVNNEESSNTDNIVKSLEEVNQMKTKKIDPKNAKDFLKELKDKKDN